MGPTDEALTERDYPWLITLDEAMIAAMTELEIARECGDMVMLGFHLKQASRAMRSALEIYGARVEAEIERGKV
jgi:hypothetical protein